MIEISCAVCGGTDRTVLYESTLDPQRNTGDPVDPYGAHYQINRCRRCGLVYSSPILASREVSRLYTGSIDTNVGSEEWPNVRVTMQGYYALARPFIPDRRRMLDIGCDIGLLLDVARADGFRELYGLEPNPTAAQVAERIPGAKIIRDFYETQEFPDANFDLITLVHVLDHLVNPAEVLKRAHRHLRPGGIVFAVVHNVESVLGRVLRERFPIFNLYHHYFFSRRTLRQLFANNGFEVLRVAPTSNSYSLGFLVQKIPLALARTARRGLDAIGIGRLRVTMPLGNIAIVARRSGSGEVGAAW